MATQETVSALYSAQFRGEVSIGEEIDNCLADAKTYKLRYCKPNNGGKSEVEAAHSFHLQGGIPADIAKIIIDTRKSGGF